MIELNATLSFENSPILKFWRRTPLIIWLIYLILYLSKIVTVGIVYIHSLLIIYAIIESFIVWKTFKGRFQFIFHENYIEIYKQDSLLYQGVYYKDKIEYYEVDDKLGTTYLAIELQEIGRIIAIEKYKQEEKYQEFIKRLEE